MEQRDDDGRHETRLSENIHILNRRNAYDVFDSHRWKLVHFDSPLTLHGDVYVGAGGGLLPRERYASLEIEVRMDLSGWWQNPPTGWTVQDEQVTEVLKLEVNNKDWFEDPEAVTQTVYRRFTLRFCEFTAELGGEDVNPKEK